MDLITRWTIKLLHISVVFMAMTIIKGYGLSSKRQVPPTFLDTGRRNVTVYEGELAILKCRIKDLGPKQVAWRKLTMDYPLTVGKMTFDTEEDISVEFNDFKNGITEWNLVIKRAQPRHTGTYECQISAKSIYTHLVYLHVLDEPAEPVKAIEISGTEYVNLYEQIKLTCNVTFRSEKAPSLDWFHRGNVIKTQDPRWASRLDITRYIVPGRYLHSDLIIRVSSMRDGGRYVCRSIDYLRNTIHTASMDVNVLNINKEPKRRDPGDDSRTQVGEQTGTGKSSCGHLECLVSHCLLIFTFFLILR